MSTNTTVSPLRQRLSKDFAKYVEVARIEPITIEETQALLHPDEALILILATDAEPPVARSCMPERAHCLCRIGQSTRTRLSD